MNNTLFFNTFHNTYKRQTWMRYQGTSLLLDERGRSKEWHETNNFMVSLLDYEE